MSATEWKPGDVAMVTATNRAKEYRAFFNGNAWLECEGHGVLKTPVTARRLVVLDPESAEDVGRLLSAYYSIEQIDVGTSSTTEMQAALRELANPTRPKPDEPTGLGAVMEDKAGCLWIRSGASHVSPNWRRCGEDEWHDYDDIDAVRVLSEGVPE